MPNGKGGDHPITDVLIHGLPAFDQRIDHLIREIKGAGGWTSEIANAYMLAQQSRLWQLRREGAEEEEATLLNNLRFLLEDELRTLRSRP